MRGHPPGLLCQKSRMEKVTTHVTKYRLSSTPGQSFYPCMNFTLVLTHCYQGDTVLLSNNPSGNLLLPEGHVPLFNEVSNIGLSTPTPIIASVSPSQDDSNRACIMEEESEVNTPSLVGFHVYYKSSFVLIHL